MENTIEIINGKKIAEEFCKTIKARVENLKEQGIFPCLALINASDDPASGIYVSKKEKQAASLG
ncbi:MAG: bifunctional 5,10-methylene-tetrahydrofolate dehydrogenase/5,10-methylene-tetrahydrofolate cyclohydrolase, partial [Alphaproteobacteria bacterium]|nr:bifunctional 5,10-methylene-tetrahydrofolate dehydrogenase/5,10-methylene-tetrahydrofolate cyclohydrolase [Alphaproteobacteria bacterium]